MKYICLIYHEAARIEAMPDEEFDALVAGCGAWVSELESSARHIFSSGLQAPGASATLRELGGSLSVTDGPYSETKEFLGGFTVLEARDLNEAIQLASHLPAMKLGRIEVRPVLERSSQALSGADQKIADSLRRVYGALPSSSQNLEGQN